MNPAETRPTPTDALNPDPVLLLSNNQGLIDGFHGWLSPRFAITTAASVSQANDILQSAGFKVVVADDEVPLVGVQLLEGWRQAFPRMQSIFLFDAGRSELLLPIVQNAGLRYLTKPVAIPDLINAVADAAKAHDDGGA